MSLLEELTAPKTHFDHEVWRQLVIAVADETTDAASAREVLERLGKTEEDLRSAVGTLRSRRQMAARKETATQAAADHQAAIAAIEVEHRRFAELQREHDLIVNRLVIARDEHLQTMIAAQGVDAELVRSCTDPDLLQQIRDCERETQSLDRTRRDIASRRSAALEQKSEAVIHNRIADAQRMQERLNKIAAEQRAVDAEQAKINQRLEQIRQAMLSPDAI